MPAQPAPLPVPATVPGSAARELGPRQGHPVVLCHGFTGTVQSLGRWPDALAEAGYRVDVPRLPGHGRSWRWANRTGWQDWYRATERSLLRSTVDSPAVVGGLSMGGALALALAIAHPRRVAGLVLVNPAVRAANPLVPLAPVLRHVLPSAPGIASDIADPAAPAEIAYDRVPVHALASQLRLWSGVRTRLGEVTCPVLLLRSATDHVVPARSSREILQGVSSPDVTEVVLVRSHHVATLDHEAGVVCSESTDFVRRVLG
ncbi:carboxylesterase [Kytococcus aerolatus]|uniref:Carboxylesterase n=1 Tax=Kytococcus aerolatus TaxID=592308 RepID=A0A212T4C2_9MICO|nr:alpha/beta fold hydrolase [Kytococcus aerolatus]SNC60700.1 carboxylesterase [Kytococcus aerolatus]